MSSLLDIKQAAKLLGLGESTLYQMCRDGRITHVRMGAKGGLYRFRPEWIDLYLEENTIHAGDAPSGRPVARQERKPAPSSRKSLAQPSAMEQLKAAKE